MRHFERGALPGPVEEDLVGFKLVEPDDTACSRRGAGHVTSGGNFRLEAFEDSQHHEARVSSAYPELCSRAWLLVLNLERFVLDLPPGATAGGEFGDGTGRDRQISDEAVLLCPLTLAIRVFDARPIDDQRVIGGAHRTAKGWR